MIEALAVCSFLSLVGCAICVRLTYRAARKVQIVKSVPCIHCRRQVPVRAGELEGPKECHMCQSRRM